MGGGIAALAASAGIPVVLLDVPGENDPLEVVRKGLEHQRKLKPPAFMEEEALKRIELGSLNELERLEGCDWILEVVVEKLEVKRALYARLEPFQAIVSSNTSSIPMKQLLEGRSEEFRRRFLGTHFFNPPRYLHLLELIPTPETDPEVLASIRQFGERILGKGVVLAKDAPGFVANRLGVYGMILAIRLMERFGLEIDEVDALTGPLLGRPNSATFRTADLTGLDVLRLVAGELARGTGEDFSLPAWVEALVDEGALGEKSGRGFYRRVNGEIQTFDPASKTYRPRKKLALPELELLQNAPLHERLRGALRLPGKYGAFLRALFAQSCHYTLLKAPEIAYDLPSVDRAMEWGFGWSEGPFRNMDALGRSTLEGLFQEEHLAVPPLLAQAEGGFYREGQVLGFDGAYHRLPEQPGVISLKALRAAGKVLAEYEESALLDLGEGVALFENRAKMGTLGEGVIQGLHRALDWLEAHPEYAGLVLSHEDPRTYSAGANLVLLLQAAQEEEWDELARAVRRFQQTSLRLRGTPFPVVSAPFGLTLGGGAEWTLHSDRVQAHAELYMGLVEVGVGLIPAGGGTKELLYRFTRELLPYGEEADLFAAVRRAFELIALAKTSGSAMEARAMGFLRHGDGITMNRERLIGDAQRQVLLLAPDYRPTLPPKIPVLGDQALGNLRYALWQFQEAGQATPHDVRIGEELAQVLSGGGGPARELSEEELLGLEREAFLKLLGTRPTQERIAHMLKTGKPLRN
jgi:3-hydroxyacyl-CoA dehydrogenase